MTRIVVVARLISFFALRSSFIGAMFLMFTASSVNAQTVTRRSTDGPSASSAGSYALSDFDNINLASGKLNFTLPLLTIGGRGTAQYTMMLPISRNWSVRSQGHYQSCYGTQICFYWDYYYPETSLGDKLMPGFGPGVMQVKRTGSITTTCTTSQQNYGTTLTLVIFTMPDGSEIELRDAAHNGQPRPANPCGALGGASRGTVFVSADGSAMTFTSDSPIIDDNSLNTPVLSAATGNLQMRDGTRYRIVNSKVESIRDSNGNFLNFTYDSPAPYGKVTQVVDPLGRKVDISYTPYMEISFTGFNGTLRHIRIGGDSTPGLRYDYQPLTWAQAFPELNGTSQWSGGPGPSGRGYVEIPDGRRYYFYYNPYGELARVELPTGGAYEYDWASGSGIGSGAWAYDGTGGIYRRVITRRVYDNGGIGNTYTGKKTIDRAPNSPLVVSKDYERINGQDVLLARTDHYYYGNPTYTPYPTVYPGWSNALEYKTDYFATNGTTLLRSVSYTWQPRVTYSWAAADPRLVETVTTLADTNQVSKQTSINPHDGTIGFDQYNNQTDIWEYDYGQVFVRRAHTDYANATNLINGLDYTTTDIHLRNLPTEQWISTDVLGNSKQALTTYEYDNYIQDALHEPLRPYPGVTISNLDPGYTDSYTKRGNVTSMTRYSNAANATGATTGALQYDIAGNVVKTIDGRGYATTFDFADRFGSPDTEAQGNTAPSELGTLKSYAFPTKVTNALGQIAYSQYDYYLGASVNSEDANGIVSSQDYGNGGLDLLDRPSKIVRAINNASTKSQTSLVYDDVNHRITTTSDLNAYGDNLLKGETIYDGLGRTAEKRQYETASTYITVKQTYDALGRSSQTSNPYRAGDTVEWTTTAYDALSRVKSVNTPDNAVVSTDYLGNSVTVTDQESKKRKSVTDALGRLRQVYEDPDALNLLTSYSYDVLDSLTTVSQGSQTRTFAYDSLKRLKSASNPEICHQQDYLCIAIPVTYEYYEDNSLKNKTDARSITTHFEYDPLGRIKSKSYQNDLSGTPSVHYYYDSETLPAGVPTFDRGSSTGRLVAALYGGTQSTTGSYLGYDDLGRVKGSVQVTNGNSASDQLTVNLALNKPATQSSTHDPITGAGKAVDGNTNGRMWRGHSSATNIEANAWWEVNLGSVQPITSVGIWGRTDCCAEMTSNFYVFVSDSPFDSYNLNTTLNQPGVSNYYLPGYTPGTISINRTGRYVRVQLAGTQYLVLGEVKVLSPQANDGQANQTYALNYDYDRAGNLKTQTYPSGRVVTTEYDTAGRIAGIKNYASGVYYAGGSSVSNDPYYANRVQYTAHGAMSQVRRGNGLWEHTNFNLRLQPEQIGLGTQSTNSSVLQLDYTYGVVENGVLNAIKNNGNLQSQSITMPSLTLTQTYAYDELNRLQSAQEKNGQAVSWKQTFLPYDRFGNRRIDSNPANTTPALVGDNPVISDTTNRISPQGEEHYWYDAAGNLEGAKTDRTYGYDAENRQVSSDHSQTGGVAATYSYDGDGRRVKKVFGNVTTVFVYNVMGQLVAEYTNVGPFEAGGTSYLTADHLGTPRVITKADGTVKSRHDYLPFGEELFEALGIRTLPQGYVGDNIAQKFTSKERDNETGLDYFLARYYSSTQGRFTSVDPEQAGARNDDPQSWNGYPYARNSPLVYTDPDGRKVTVCDPQGNNCVTYRDSEFNKLREGGPADGYTFKNGNIYYNGELTGTYSNDCLYCGGLITGMAQRAPASQKLILGFAALNLAPAVGIVGSMTAAGGGLTTLGTLSRAAPAAGAGATVVNQLSRTDASIFQRAARLGASAQNTFLNNRNILADATFQENPTFKLNIIGKIGNSPIWGSIPSRVGIAEVNGVTVIVKMVRGNPQILGPLP